MYGAMRPRYAPFFRGTCLWGAYATDFFKFEDGQTADELPVGIPTKDGGGIPDEYFEPDAVKVQVDGIKNELETLGRGDTIPAFVLTSKTLLHPAVLDGLSAGFPGMKYARINHYQHANARLLKEALAVQVPAAHTAFTGRGAPLGTP